MSAVPPVAPESRPAEITARVHRMRVARGACWVIVAALLTGGGLALLDALTPLPSWFRGVALAAWLTGIGVLVWWLVARRLPPDPSARPRHAKTELAGNLRAAAAAALALASSLCAATLVPGAGEHIRRVTLPWTRTGGPVLYRVKVTAGDPVVRRGDSVTLSAYAEKIDHSTATPDAATLIWRDRAGGESSMTMTGDGTGAFHGTRSNVTRGFDYRVEVGGSSSDWHMVSVLDPVEPTGRSRIELTPPPYSSARGATVVSSFGSIEGHQFSTASIHLHFSQPAGAAFLEWRGDDGSPAELIPIAFDPERASGTASFRLTRNGELKLVTVAETMGKSLRSEFPVRVRVEPDTPPRFELLSGLSPRPRTARPDVRIGIAFTAVDDLAVGSAVLEYAAGDKYAKVTTIPIELMGSSPGRVQGRLDFDLSGKARAGEVIRLRLRITDNRRLDNPAMSPQSAIYPETGWSIVRIDPAASPIDEQDIVAERTALGDALEGALEAVKSAQTEVGQARRDTLGKTDLPLDQTVRLANVRDGVRRIADKLRNAAREAALTAELRGLAGMVAETADRPFRSADASLKQAATNNSKERDVALTAAIDSLRAAMAALDRQLLVNQRIARARLDRKAILALVTDQAAVANLAQPGGTIGAEELARLGRELHARLRKLTADSDALRAATETAKEGEVRRLELTLRELAGLIRDLDSAARTLESEATKSLLGEAARQQGRNAEWAGRLFSRARSAARVAGCELPDVKEVGRIAELIESGRTVEALTELETRAQRLDAIALAMEKWAQDHRDPKLAARQLGAWQDDILNRFRAATKGNPANFPALADAEKAAFRQEQSALQHFAQVLPIPRGVDVRSLHKELILHISIGAEPENPERAEKSMSNAIELFTRIADAIPTIPERLTKTRAELAPIITAQEAIQLEAEQAIRAGDAARKLPGLVGRQQKLVAAFRALDLPGLESRAIVIERVLGATERDLREGAVSDTQASQQWLKREFDRLRLVLDGMAAPDDRAEELALKLAALAQSVHDVGPNYSEKQLQGFAAEALALARQVSALASTAEAPALANDARVAALQLESAARDATTKPEEFVDRLRPAAEATNRLAARLTSFETDIDRVRRLAASRWSDWEKARKAQGKAPNPDASAETRRQLVHEAEELTHTRVGFAGQAHKKAVLDQYLRLKDHDAPDRQGGPLKALAQSLDELAALMVDVEDLCTPIDRTHPRPPGGGPETYIPTRERAASFRELAAQHRDLRKRVVRASEEARFLIRPSLANRIAPLEQDQRELAAAITALARQIEREKDDASKLALDAAIQATLAADGLAVGMLGPAQGSAERAAEGLRRAATRGATKPWSTTATGLAARQEAQRAKLLEHVPPGEIAAQQRARGAELARRAGATGKQLQEAARLTGLSELMTAAKELAAVETLILESTNKTELPADAGRLRVDAANRVDASAKKVMACVPAGAAKPDLEPSAVKAAGALRRADIAMSQALDALESNAGRTAAEKAMRQASEALSAAAAACAELYGGAD